MSFYLRHPDVEPVRIRTYPKRHRFAGPADDLRLPLTPSPITRPAGVSELVRDACYGDFFRAPEEIAS